MVRWAQKIAQGGDAVERRSFLRGLLAAVAGGEAVVKLATPSDVAALTVGRDTLIGQPQPARLEYDTYPLAYDLMDGGDCDVYVKRGSAYLSIGRITEVSICTDPIRTGEEFGFATYAPGVSHLEGRFVGPLRSAR
jgi:hypothetical protein